ncbi:MAG: signal peptidase [Planctomycetales bacterium]|nr:signal peptidase [Planctomycetales bacterium]
MPNFIVRCGVMRTLHVMQAKQDFARGARVITRTSRGLEAGDVLCEATEQAVAQLPEPPGGTIQRLMTQEDENELAHIAARADDEAEMCIKHIHELNLPMDLVDVERVFGGERVVIYYLSESRVDFRELVKLLAHDFQTRVEMRQIGVRDEAKLLADYGDCGKPVCCNSHLVKMPPVSMKMAKMQKATLDPNKISGRCGRLKCCLRYEFDIYDEHRKSLPRVGVDIVTGVGRGRVLGQEILARQLLVQMEDNRRILIHVDEVLSVLTKRNSDRDVTDSLDDDDSQELE